MRFFLHGEFLLAKGQRAAAAGDPAAALAAYDRALTLRPDFAPALLYKAISLGAQQDHDLAADSARQAVALAPQRPAYRLVQGMMAYDAGDIALALTSFTHAVHLAPANRLAAAYVHLAKIRSGLPHPDPGDLAALGPLMLSTNAAFQARWLVLCESAIREKARTLAEQMIAASYLEPIAQRHRSLPQRWLAGLSAGVAGAAAITPRRRAALVLERRAEAKLAAGDLDGALADLAEAVAMRPGAEGLLEKYLDLCLYRGKYEPILQWAGASVDVKAPENRPGRPADDREPLLVLLGMVRFHQGAVETATGLLQAAAEADRLDWLAPYYLGACHLSARRPDTARTWFQKAVSVPNPDIARLRLEEWQRCLQRP